MIASAPIAANAPRLSKPAWGVLGLILLLRLVLSSHHEIIAFWDDDLGYAHLSGSPFWNWAYGPYSHVRQPVYPLFLHACTLLGVPTRIAIEAVWILSNIVLVGAARRCGLHTALALLVGGLVLLHPWTFTLLDRLLQDTLFTPVFMALVPSLAAAVAARDQRSLIFWSAIVAILAPLAATTRPESVLVFLLVLSAGGAVLVSRLFSAAATRLTLARLTLGVVLPLATTIGTTTVIRAVNARSLGIALQHDLSSPGLADLYDALLAMRPGHPILRVPITRDVRERAYDLSPSFASLRCWIDGDGQAPGFKHACALATGVSDEYGSWMVWALRHAAWQKRTDWPNGAVLDDFYRQCAREIRDGCAQHATLTRSVPISFVAPEWSLMRADLWPTLGRCWTQLAHPQFVRFGRQPNAHQLKVTFDRVASRRQTLVRFLDSAFPKQSTGWNSSPNIARLDRIKSALAHVSFPTLALCLACTCMGVFLAPLALRRGAVTERWGMIFFISLTALIMRVTLLIMLDMSGIPSQQRYLLPIFPLLVLTGMLALQAIVAAICSFRHHRRPA